MRSSLAPTRRAHAKGWSQRDFQRRSVSLPVDCRPIRTTIVTDAHLRFYEKLVKKISSQGTASFTQSHRTPPNTGIPGYDKMSFEQRWLAQDQAGSSPINL